MAMVQLGPCLFKADESKNSDRAFKSHWRKGGLQPGSGGGLKIWPAKGKCRTGKEGERRKRREGKRRKKREEREAKEEK